ncbi:motility protein A [Clostridium oryzae]|uniref:Chemotaxis protein PomA n=1 Tax=Clostridium oryzae TaxID=1450648 RepID=A0A1V4I458_9CLOT|nr:MotA/TolQ/ExbB proton channel family protein [Clostridium oryzae]OPJ54771.1 chemotaxis protein PomA [Clostridium oryzae]
MDIFTTIGMTAAIGFVLLSILTSGSIVAFIDVPSVLITVGGTFGAILIGSSGKNLKNFIKVLILACKETKLNEIELIDKFAEYAAIARKNGLLSLEETASSITDSFTKSGMIMVIDGMEPDIIRKTLAIKIKGILERHKNNRGVFDTGAALAPAFGMIGTLIGLVNMLRNLSDPSSIGPQMSVALITTFYGSLMSNILFMPISRKLKAKTSEEIYQKEIIIEGLLSIQAGESPTILRKKLLAYLDDKQVEKANQVENS